VRVTLAHEFFHVVQFGIDYNEFRGWMEMSAVWMEEEQYDHMNDYYSVLHYFFDHPRASLQSPDLFHQYGSSVFPIYLSERHGRDIIRDIWLRCGDLGTGSDWLQAVSEAVDSAASRWVCVDGSFETVCYDSAWLLEDLAYALREFAVWNYFTGRYSGWAPNDMGYSEKDHYPAIPDSAMRMHNRYPDTVGVGQNVFSPQINASTYIRLEDLQLFVPESHWVCDSLWMDTLYDTTWICDSLFDTICYDSHLVCDTLLDTLYCDSSWVTDDSFTVFYYIDSDPELWGVSAIYQFENFPDSHDVESWFALSGGSWLAQIPNPLQYRSVTLIFTPVTTDTNVFYTGAIQELGYALLDSSGGAPLPPSALVLPYPNPAVVSNMGLGAAAEKGKNVWFRFQVPRELVEEFSRGTLLYKVDIYTVAGEAVNSLEGEVPTDRIVGPSTVEFDIPWDMRNAGGNDVASGVYLVYTHIYADDYGTTFLAEDHAKVVIIR